MIRRRKHFSGSYRQEDVCFLLRRLQITPTNLAAREAAIQFQKAHYSEMIGPEDRPSRERLSMFRSCLEQNGARFAMDLSMLAEKLILSARTSRLTLVSLARAGTPVGILLRRIILQRTGWRKEDVPHYSISVIRDRGVDLTALHHILRNSRPENIRFIDGWTGKGTIAGELAKTLEKHLASKGRPDPGLWVPLDISGVAIASASREDYLIPSVLLGGTLSGLVSRSILPRKDLGRKCFHGCLELGHLRRYDLSRWFIHIMMEKVEARGGQAVDPKVPMAPPFFRHDARNALGEIAREFRVMDLNRLKVGFGETVRVLLRRVPHRILVQNPQSPDARQVVQLACLRGVEVEIRPAMFYQAVAIIKDLRNRQ